MGVVKWQNCDDCICFLSTVKQYHIFSFYFLDPWKAILPLWTPSPFPPPSPLWTVHKCWKFNFRMWGSCSRSPTRGWVKMNRDWRSFWGRTIGMFGSILPIIIFIIGHPMFVRGSRGAAVPLRTLTIGVWSPLVKKSHCLGDCYRMLMILKVILMLWTIFLTFFRCGHWWTIAIFV